MVSHTIYTIQHHVLCLPILSHQRLHSLSSHKSTGRTNHTNVFFGLHNHQRRYLYNALLCIGSWLFLLIQQFRIVVDIADDFLVKLMNP